MSERVLNWLKTAVVLPLVVLIDPVAGRMESMRWRGDLSRKLIMRASPIL